MVVGGEGLMLRGWEEGEGRELMVVKEEKD
jgi:hypothetical protein